MKRESLLTVKATPKEVEVARRLLNKAVGDTSLRQITIITKALKQFNGGK